MYDCTEIQTDKLNALNRKTDWNKLTTRVTKFHFYFRKLGLIRKLGQTACS